MKIGDQDTSRTATVPLTISRELLAITLVFTKQSLRSGGSVLFKRLPTTRAQICTDGPLAQAFHVKAVPTH